MPGIIIAIIAAYLTGRWSLKKIYSEKWWERKEKAYSGIIESLYDIMEYLEIQRDYAESGRKYSEDRMKEIIEKNSIAYWKLKKVTVIGGFIISNEGAKVLRELRNRPMLKWNKNPPFDIYDQDYEYYKEALEKIIVIANKDLKVNKS